jgi:hypothetical protein
LRRDLHKNLLGGKQIRRLSASIGIGLLTATALITIRGGFEDYPALPFIFAGAGFLVAYAIAWLISPEIQRLLGAGSRLRTRVALIRDLTAFCIAVSALFWFGPVIEGGGYAAWLYALFLGVVVPLAVVLCCARWPIAWGLVTATCLFVSTFAMQFLREGVSAARVWDRIWQHELWIAMTWWATFVGLSLVVSVPLAIQRSRIANRST